MDLVSSCKDKLAYFRIKELKDVLTQLGLSKQGKKQDLVERILAILSDEQVNDRVYGLWAKKSATGKQEVARLVDDTYRKMQVSGASDLASKGQCTSDSSTVKPKEEIEDSYPKDKIRCLCGSSLQTDSMIKCEDPRCHIWQHIGCVIIPDKPVEGIPPAHPDIFYCEVCRLGRADPFWVTVAHPLYPVKLTTSNVPADGTNPMQSVEKSFQLTRADKDLLLKQEYDVQAWCMLLNDKVPFRMQWPQYADLQINGVPVRAINRPGSQLLGANGRDDGPIITPCTRDGINKILLTRCDSRMFCLGVRIVKHRSLQQILNMIPKESDGEKFDDALVRVCRCVGGGAATENADSDSDLEIVSDSIPVNLRCPMSGSRMKVAGRFKPCPHMGCFDLEVFVEMNQRSRKWQCPICLKNYSLDNIIIDPYFNRITSKMRSCGEDITEIEVKPDGSWRAKVEGDRSSRDLGDLGLWHLPNGSLCLPPTVEGKVVKVKSEAALNTNVKQEDVSETHRSLRIGIRKNPNGCWEVSKQERLSSGNHRVDNKLENNHNIIPMSSSATGSGRDGEDASVNQDGCGNFDFSANNGIELDSISPQNIEQLYGFTNTNTSSLRDAEVIVLSDSDDENNIITPTVPPSSVPVMYNNHAADKGGVTFPLQTDSYPEYPVLGTGASSCLGGPFMANDDDFGMPLWPLPPGNQAGPSFQLFGSGSDAADVSDALVDFQHSSIGCPTSMNGYTECAMGSGALLPQSSGGRSNPDMNDDLVDNPLTFSRDDPSLQIFLPTRPDTSGMLNLRDQPDVSNSLRSDDWISLRLGDGGGSTSGQGHSASANGGVNLQQKNISKEEAQDSLAETASLLLGMNDNRSGKTNRELSDSPFSFPRQRRSVRPRLYLSIDSDSD